MGATTYAKENEEMKAKRQKVQIDQDEDSVEELEDSDSIMPIARVVSPDCPCSPASALVPPRACRTAACTVCGTQGHFTTCVPEQVLPIFRRSWGVQALPRQTTYPNCGPAARARNESRLVAKPRCPLCLAFQTGEFGCQPNFLFKNNWKETFWPTQILVAPRGPLPT